MGLENKELESKLQKEVIKLVHSFGGYVVKVHVSAYQNQGTPDIIVCYMGKFIAFELKEKGNKTSSIQDLRIRQIQNAGGIAKAIYSLKEIEETLYEIQRLQPGGKSS